MGKVKKKEDDYQFDLGDVVTWTLDFIDDIVKDKNSRFTRTDVIRIMLLSLQDEFGGSKAECKARQAIIAAENAVYALPDKNWYRLTAADLRS